MIPKTVHQIWIGEKPIPEPLVRYSQSWNAYHPDWTVALWTDFPGMHTGPAWSEIRELPPLINDHVIEEIEPLVKCHRCMKAALSDLYRYELLAQFGGVYADLDMEVFRRIDPLLQGVQVACADEWGPNPGNYLLAAEPNHPLMWTIVREVLGNVRFLAKKKRGQKVNPVLLTGPRYISHYFPKCPEAVIWPWPVFNPLKPEWDQDLVEFWPTSAYGNHHFAGSWYRRQYKPPEAPFVKPRTVEEAAA